MPEITVTEKQLADAFTEWARRYKENPKGFASDTEALMQRHQGGYGSACASYLMELINEQSTEQDGQ